MSQPAGTYYDAAISNKAFLTRNVLILDAGYYSVDWIFFFADEPKLRLSGTSKFATSYLLEQASARLQKAYDVKLSPARIERLICDGFDTIPVGMDDIPVDAILKKAVEEICPKAIKDVQSVCRYFDDTVEIVLLTGGSGKYYEAAVRKLYPKAEIMIPEKPVSANVRGFWVYGAECSKDKGNSVRIERGTSRDA